MDLSRKIPKSLESARNRTAAIVSLDIEGDCTQPQDVTLALFRIAQESLNNVAKHADATEVSVKLACEPQGVVLSINDNGRGFAPSDILPGHLGVGIMRERARKIGATLHVNSELDRGACVSVAWSAQGNETDHG
jgi:signal transduction histidine kinase